MNQTARFSIALYGETGAAVMSQTWADKLQYYYDLSVASAEPNFVYTAEHHSAWAEQVLEARCASPFCLKGRRTLARRSAVLSFPCPTCHCEPLFAYRSEKGDANTLVKTMVKTLVKTLAPGVVKTLVRTEFLFGVRNVLVKTRVKTFYCSNFKKKSDGEKRLGGAV